MLNNDYERRGGGFWIGKNKEKFGLEIKWSQIEEVGFWG